MEAWEKLTNPETLRESLMGASVFISSYEMCREFVVSKPKTFFCNSLDESDIDQAEYNKNILSLHKSPLKASLLWFKSLGAIDDNDLKNFNEAREHRNSIAHNLPSYISDPNFAVDLKIFEALLETTHKVGVYWVVNYEMGLDPEIDIDNVPTEDIKIGTILMINMTMQIAFGKEPEASHIYNELKKKLGS